MADEFGLTLAEAAEQYTDPAEWQVYRAATKKAERCRVRDRSLDIRVYRASEWSQCDIGDRDDARAASECNRLIDVRDRAGRAVTRDLWERLYSGELIATGIEYPPRLESKRMTIAPHFWRLVGPEYRDSSLKGDGIKILDVRVRRACDDDRVTTASIIEPNTDSCTQPVSAVPQDEGTIVVPPRGRPGRKGLPQLFEQEMRRRAAAGELYESLNQECRYLEAWGMRKLRNPKGEPWAISTIRNKLRGVYRELEARKSDPK